MKPEVEAALVALGQVAREDIAELRDAVAEIDERYSDPHRRIDYLHGEMVERVGRLDMRLSEIEAILADNASHSRATPDHYFTGDTYGPCIHCGRPYGDHPAREEGRR